MPWGGSRGRPRGTQAGAAQTLGATSSDDRREGSWDRTGEPQAGTSSFLGSRRETTASQQAHPGLLPGRRSVCGPGVWPAACRGKPCTRAEPGSPRSSWEEGGPVRLWGRRGFSTHTQPWGWGVGGRVPCCAVHPAVAFWCIWCLPSCAATTTRFQNSRRPTKDPHAHWQSVPCPAQPLAATDVLSLSQTRRSARSLRVI